MRALIYHICAVLCLGVASVETAGILSAQEAIQGIDGPSTAAASVVPQQIRYAGKLATRSGDTVEAEFRIYAGAEGGDPLWTETQRVTVGEDGSYSVLLGNASPAGLPQTVFAGGAARWLGVSVERSAEQERILLSSVPYAMKSADAESLAGHAASDFVTQNQLAQFGRLAQASQHDGSTPELQPNTLGTITGSGTAGTVPLWTGALTQGNSEITQVGKSIGINEATPAATLDVNGTAQFRGTLTLPAVATATSSSSSSSQFLNFAASAWSSTTNSPVSPGFQMFAYPVNSNTANPTAKFYMQYRKGSSTTTLFSVNSEGIIGFAPGQTFPGTIESVSAISPVTAVTASGSVSLGLNVGALVTDIAPTLNNNYAQLTAENTFTGDYQQFQGSVDIVGQAGAGSGLLTVTNESTAVDTSSIFATSFNFYPTIYADGNEGGVAIAGYGATSSEVPAQIGILGGMDDVQSGTFKRDNGTFGYSAGVWADDPVGFATAALFATADGTNAAVFENNSGSAPTIYVANLATSGPTGNAVLLRAEGAGGECSINQGGSMACTGQLKNLVTTHDARQVETYSVQSAENWIEDYGGGQLENGSVIVTLDAAFAGTVNTGAEFHVFLTPKGDCEGLYVTNQTPTSFEVHELRKGQSNVAFDYKIVARRSGHEAERLVDVTDRMKLEAASSHFKPVPDGPPANPHSPGVSRASRKLHSALAPKPRP
ncbi:MAG: hypothetical protein ABSG96_24515 [Terracidiphilus sp.]